MILSKCLIITGPEEQLNDFARRELEDDIPRFIRRIDQIVILRKKIKIYFKREWEILINDIENISRKDHGWNLKFVLVYYGSDLNSYGYRKQKGREIESYNRTMIIDKDYELVRDEENSMEYRGIGKFAKLLNKHEIELRFKLEKSDD